MAEEEYPYLGTQMQITISGDYGLCMSDSTFDGTFFGDDENGDPIEMAIFGVRGHASYFSIPSAQVHQGFVYFGPFWLITPYFWVSPHVGAVAGWGPELDDGFLASLWLNFEFSGEDHVLAVFAESDIYVFDDYQDYYSFASIDWKTFDFNLGLHTEGVNELFTIGPHFGFTILPFKFEAQYHIGFQEDNKGQSVRIITSLMF